MSLLLAASALFTAPLPADPRWYRIAGDEYGVYYVEASTIREESGIKTAVTMSANSEPNSSGAYNVIVVVEYKCAAGSYRDMLFNFLDRDGNVLRKEEAQSGPEFRTPKSGSFNDLMLRFVCTGEGGTPVSEPLGDSEDWFANQ